MKFYLFLDESGDHGISKIDPKFPILVLCGVLISEKKYSDLTTQIICLKQELFGSKEVIFHSREIRRKEGPFYLFTDKQKWAYFLSEFNRIVSETSFRVISAVIRKESYKDRPGNPLVGAYGHALTFIVERCVFCLDEVSKSFDPQLNIIAESRGTDYDYVIKNHIGSLKSEKRGTGFVPAFRINQYGFFIKFKTKEKNLIGLQVADLMAHPIARYVLNNYEESPPFTVLKPRLYNDGKGNFKGFGLKVYPE